MNIAIVDDNPQDRREAEAIFKEYLAAHHPGFSPSLQFTYFDSAESFLAVFVPKSFSLILLDIYMEQLDGIEAAKEIRSRDANCPIIFLTTSTDHALDGYTVFAAGYLLKPLRDRQDAFYHTLEHCLPKLIANQRQLDVIVENVPLKIPLRRLLYIDCNNSRNVTLHMADCKIHASNSYNDCRDVLLTDPAFLESYHRIVVNMDFIESMNEDTFQMANHELVPISRRKKNQVKQQYMSYLITK